MPSYGSLEEGSRGRSAVREEGHVTLKARGRMLALKGQEGATSQERQRMQLSQLQKVRKQIHL